MRLSEGMALLAGLLLLAGPAMGAPRNGSPFRVTGGWFRALPAGLPAGGYFTIHSGIRRTVSIVRAQSSGCGALELHRSSMQGGMSAMERVQSVDLPPGQDVVFAPGGYHLMCIHPTPAMKPCRRVPVVLMLSIGISVAAAFQVRGARGR